MTGSGRRGHIIPVLKYLHWLPVCFQAQFKVLVLTFKALNSLCPVYLKERLHPHCSARRLRSSSKGLLAVPPLQEVRLQGTGQRAFLVVAPAPWNTLPSDVKEINNCPIFRRYLKKMSDSDDDVPQLSSEALSALQEFYIEQQQREDIKATERFDNNSLGSIEENWQLSQFWYDAETAVHLANEAARAVGSGGRIACVSAPSVYQKLKERDNKDFSTCLLEYDQRFSVYGAEYVFYDYNNPLNLPANLTAHSFDIVVADPPYLSEECLRKTAETIKYLTKGKVLLCTGAVMEDYAAKYLGVKMSKFIPKHTRNLANEFRCYVNYDSGLDSDSVS